MKEEVEEQKGEEDLDEVVSMRGGGGKKEKNAE